MKKIAEVKSYAMTLIGGELSAKVVQARGGPMFMQSEWE